MEFYKALDALLRRDEGKRGFCTRAKEANIAALSKELFARGERILIITGFPARAEDGHVCCETDGPPGAANLARAFCDLGREVRVATDETCFPQVRAAIERRVPEAALVMVTEGNHSRPEEILGDFLPTHAFALERPGQGADGCCRNAKGMIIDHWLTETDSLFAYAKRHGAATIGIGDGGNELGMGNHMGVTAQLLAGGQEIAASQRSDWPLVCGVSNWWGWGIAALLSVEAGRLLLPDRRAETGLLAAAVGSGAMDGITKAAEMSVDNLPLEKHLALLDEITALTRAALKGEARYA